MSVLIKGMDIPQNCDECSFAKMESEFHGICTAIRNDVCYVYPDKGKPEWCPLVEVPTQGRPHLCPLCQQTECIVRHEGSTPSAGCLKRHNRGNPCSEVTLRGDSAGRYSMVSRNNDR